MKILFNVEGNKTIGMGAFYNCLNLAKKFQQKINCEIKVFVSKESENNVEETLLSDYSVNRVDITNIDLFVKQIQEFNPDIVMQDLLSMNDDYMNQLKKLNIIVVNILHTSNFQNHLKADFVINLLYNSNDVNCLYGPKYSILSDGFKNLSKRDIKDVAENLLISFGGSDVGNISLKLIKILDKLNLDFFTNVIIGPGFGSEEKLVNLLNNLNNKEKFVINKNVVNIKGLILNSDLAFVSGGRTICELAACGTPGVSFPQNELEFGRMKEFEKWGTVLNYGYFDDINEEELLLKIKSLLKDKNLREKMSTQGQKLVDDCGVDRIVDIILKNHQKRI